MSRSRDFVESKATLSREYECKFIREQFTEIIQRKDRLLKKQELEILELKSQLKQKSKIIYVSSNHRDKFHPRIKPNSNSNAILSFKQKFVKGSQSVNMVSDINQYSALIEQYICILQNQLEKTQKEMQQLRHKTSSLEIKLQKKTQEIHLLQMECSKYYDQCNDLDFIKKIIEQGQGIGNKQIIELDQEQIIKMRELVGKLETYFKSQHEKNEIDSIANTLKLQCERLSLTIKSN